MIELMSGTERVITAPTLISVQKWYVLSQFLTVKLTNIGSSEIQDSKKN